MLSKNVNNKKFVFFNEKKNPEGFGLCLEPSLENSTTGIAIAYITLTEKLVFMGNFHIGITALQFFS